MRYILIVMLAMCFDGCVHVPLANVFTHGKPNYSVVPADALREVALEIEKAIQNGERDPKIASREGIAVDDPAVAQAIRMRAARSVLLNEFLNSGHCIEQKNGLVEIAYSKDYKKNTTRKQRDRNALLILNEGTDRWAIYEGLLKASKMPSRALSAIQETFHQARVECMIEGQKYEDANGQVQVKGKV